MTFGVPEIREVVFSLVEGSSDVAPLFQELTMRGEIVFEVSRKVFSLTFDELPSNASGMLQRNLRLPSNALIGGNLRIKSYDGLS